MAKKSWQTAAKDTNEKAKQKLTGIPGDLNWPGNHSAATPYQEDINAPRWKEHGVVTRDKWKNNSQPKATADRTAEGGKTFKGQPKFGGTMTTNGGAGGIKRGRNSVDSFKTVIRDH